MEVLLPLGRADARSKLCLFKQPISAREHQPRCLKTVDSCSQDQISDTDLLCSLPDAPKLPSDAHAPPIALSQALALIPALIPGLQDSLW